MLKKTCRSIFALGVLSVVAAFHGIGTIQDAHAEELKKVSVRLAFSYNGHRSPYLLGVEKGFYEEEGLDVEVNKGTGFMPAMQLLSSKEDAFAIIDAPTIMYARAQGMPVKQIFQVYHKSPNSIISWKTAGIKEPKDLLGKTVAVIQGDTQIALIKAMMRAQDLDPDGVKFFAADGGTRTQVFLGKRTEAINGFSIDSYISLKNTTGGEVEEFLLSSYGINTMGDGIAAHEDTLKDDPDMVRKFIRATIKAFDYALEHPEESIDALVRKRPEVNKVDELEKLIATKPFIRSAEALEHGMGTNLKELWESTQDLMVNYGGLKSTSDDVSVYYTNEYLPH